VNKQFLITLIIVSSLNAKINVIISQNSTIANVTKQELSNVYLKKTDSIKGQKVIVINNKDAYYEFNKKILNKTPSQIHAYWMKQIFLGRIVPPKNITTDEITQEINKYPNTIIYTSTHTNEKIIYETD